MVKHTQTIHWQQPTNCLSMFNCFVGLALKGLRYLSVVYSLTIHQKNIFSYSTIKTLEGVCGHCPSAIIVNIKQVFALREG